MTDENKQLSDHLGRMAGEARENVYKITHQLMAWLVVGNSGALAFLLNQAASRHLEPPFPYAIVYAVFLAGACLAVVGMVMGTLVGTKIGNKAAELWGISTRPVSRDELGSLLAPGFERLKHLQKEASRSNLMLVASAALLFLGLTLPLLFGAFDGTKGTA